MSAARSLALESALLAVAFSGVPSAAAPDRPDWAGYWAEDPQWCARAGEPGEETPDWIGPDGIFGLEYSCDILSVEPTGVGRSWVVRLDCLDMGDAYKARALFVLSGDDRMLTIDEEGAVFTQHRCPEGAHE